MDEIRAVAGPIVQRYFDKVEAERAAAQAAADAEAAKKREMAEAAKKAAMVSKNPFSKLMDKLKSPPRDKEESSSGKKDGEGEGSGWFDL